MNLVRQDQLADQWAAAHGGIRGSTLLRSGAVLSALAVLLESSGQLLGGTAAWGLSITAWTIWTLALVALGLAYIWIGLNPVLSRVGIFVGVAHLLHAVLLMLRIFTSVELVVSPKAMVVGRLLLVVIFAARELKVLGRRTSGFLGGSALLVMAKAALPMFGVDPDLGVMVAFLRDTLPAVILALATYHTGEVIRRRETAWASAQGAGRTSGFEDYNNPFNPGQYPEADSTDQK